MNETHLKSSMGLLLDGFHNVIGCGLVDAASGLIWYRRPDRMLDGLWEASVDHWRLHGRLARHFESLGDLGAIVIHHQAAMLALIPCLRDPDVLLICLAEHGTMDWKKWQREARVLGAQIKASM